MRLSLLGGQLQRQTVVAYGPILKGGGINCKTNGLHRSVTKYKLANARMRRAKFERVRYERDHAVAGSLDVVRRRQRPPRSRGVAEADRVVLKAGHEAFVVVRLR